MRVAGVPMMDIDSDDAQSTVSMKSHKLSTQQKAVVDWVETGEGNAFVEAVAGSGKTHSLIAACESMTGSVAFAAFNKSISVEIANKTSHLRNVRVGTFHSFGLSALRWQYPSVVIDANGKYRRMIDEMRVPDYIQSAVGRLVSICKQSVAGKLWDMTDRRHWESLIEHYDIMMQIRDIGKRDWEVVNDLVTSVTDCLVWSRMMATKVIDFDDMIWIPLIEDMSVFRNDWVLVDEVQDVNAARRLLARKMMKDFGRALMVGDRFQAIYGFTGADNDSVYKIIADFNCTLLPLTVTFRCSKKAVEMAQRWVPHIEAYEGNLEGEVRRMTYRGFIASLTTPLHKFTPDSEYGSSCEVCGCVVQESASPCEPHPDCPRPGDAILCRNTKPLISLALTLLRAGIACHVEGRDIGKSILNLATKWKVRTCLELAVKLDQYRIREVRKLMETGDEYKVEAVHDRVETVLVLMEGLEIVDELVQKIEGMFKDSEDGKVNTVILSTVHKFKGREADRVYILGMERYMPSKYARKEWEIEQERNLLYVSVTRTRNELVLVEAGE